MQGATRIDNDLRGEMKILGASGQSETATGDGIHPFTDGEAVSFVHNLGYIIPITNLRMI